MTDQEIKESVSEKALKYGVPTQYSGLFDDLPESFKIEFQENIKDRNFGLPIVRFDHPKGNWTLLGTKELCWYDLNTIRFININEIKDLAPLDREAAKLKQPDRMTYKFEFEQLGLITKNGETYPLWIHKAREYYAFWHMMIRIFKLKKDDNNV